MAHEGKRRSVALGLLLIVLAGCRKEPVAATEPQAGANSVAAYLHDAELQFESPAQGSEIRKALTDMLELSPEELRKKRYADYAMAPDAWDAVTLLHKYFLPAKPSPGLTEEGFYADVGKPEARREIDQQLKAVERSLSP